MAEDLFDIASKFYLVDIGIEKEYEISWTKNISSKCFPILQHKV